MVRIAVTGGIACGKSATAALLAQQGVAVCDADDLAHRLLRRGEPAFRRTVEAFGASIVGADGEIDRRLLGRMVFTGPRSRAALEAIVHPGVMRALREWLDEQTTQGRCAAAIVPLLYEAAVPLTWDAVICVAASAEVQRRRLMERDLDPEEAAQRIAAQMPLREKTERADYVVMNNGSRALLAEQVKRVLKRILER